MPKCEFFLIKSLWFSGADLSLYVEDSSDWYVSLSLAASPLKKSKQKHICGLLSCVQRISS